MRWLFKTDISNNSSKICENYALNNDNIFVYHKSNGGVSSARNLGLMNAKGKYVMFVDPDDWLDQKIVDELLNDIEDNNSDISICCARVHKDNNTGKNTFFRDYSGEINKKRGIVQLFSNTYYKDADNYIDVGVPWGKLYKTKFLKENDLSFNVQLRRNQDNIFNLYCFEYAKKITYIDEPLYNYDLNHFPVEKRTFTEDAIELYNYYGNEMLLFYETYYKSDELLFELLLIKLQNLLAVILRQYLCHPKIDVSLQERTICLQKIVNNHPFSKIKNFEQKNPNWKSNIVAFLLQKRQYKLVIYIYYFGFKIGV